MARAVGVWVDGQPTLIGLRTRLRLALTSLTGAPHAPVVVTVAPAVDWDRLDPAARHKAVAGLDQFLLSHPALASQVPALAAVRP